MDDLSSSCPNLHFDEVSIPREEMKEAELCRRAQRRHSFSREVYPFGDESNANEDEGENSYLSGHALSSSDVGRSSHEDHRSRANDCLSSSCPNLNYEDKESAVPAEETKEAEPRQRVQRRHSSSYHASRSSQVWDSSSASDDDYYYFSIFWQGGDEDVESDVAPDGDNDRDSSSNAAAPDDAHVDASSSFPDAPNAQCPVHSAEKPLRLEYRRCILEERLETVPKYSDVWFVLKEEIVKLGTVFDFDVDAYLQPSSYLPEALRGDG